MFIAIYLGGKKIRESESLSVYCRKSAAAVEKYAVVILIAFIIVTSAWLGFVLFKNPYVTTYNAHEAPYFVQMLYNYVSGNGPETSLYYNLDFLSSNPNYYASVFAERPRWSSIGLVALLYSLHPVPPMQVYAVILIVVILGCTGIYIAVRSLGATKLMSLLAAMGYILLPQVEHLMFIRGHFDIVGVGILPLVFASLFKRRWGWFYFMCLLYAAISYPQTLFVMFLGIITGVFFRAWKQGMIALLIGLSVMLWDNAVLRQALCGIYNNPSYFVRVIDRLLTDNALTSRLMQIFIFNIKYITLLLLAVSFLPLLGLRREGKWNLEVIGTLAFMIPSIGMSFVYGDYGFFYQRNDPYIVPIYLSAFVAYMTLKKGTRDTPNTEYLFRSLLIASIISLSLFTTAHFPWVVNYTAPKMITKDYYGIESFKTLVNEQKKNEKRRDLLEKIAEYIPLGASVACYVNSDIRAFLANRQSVWFFPNYPPGVEYFVIEGPKAPISPENMNNFRIAYNLFIDRENYQILYYSLDKTSVIIKNLHPSPIPRNEAILGWKILTNTLLMKGCNR
ncbi:MAG: hypothetical protein HQL00_08415 [Nitrospirae bacterium]|nr:hypothetical protein [Nitrospirota bacterium]